MLFHYLCLQASAKNNHNIDVIFSPAYSTQTMRNKEISERKRQSVNWVAIKVIPPWSPWKRRTRTRAVCNCQSGYDLQLRASSQQMVAEIKFVKQGRHNGAATTRGGGRRSAGCFGVRGSVKSESDARRLKEARTEPARLRAKHPALHLLGFFSFFFLQRHAT